MSDFDPYLSVVVTSRNDNHGGDLTGRMQHFLSGLAEQCNRHRLCTELLMIEWNPPTDKPKLVDGLEWPEHTAYFRSRIIEFPPEMHAGLDGAHALPLFQMIAKNVGIRRARAPFVLATNIDILFSDALMAEIAKRELRPDRMYRIDRWDIDPAVPVGVGIEEKLAYAANNLIRINAREGTFRTENDGRRKLENDDIAPLDSGLHFGDGWFHVERYSEQERVRWASDDAWLHLDTATAPSTVLEMEIEPNPVLATSPIELEVTDEAGEVVASGRIERRQRIVLRLPTPDGKAAFCFRAVGGGRPLPPDPRVLVFRAYSCRPVAQAAFDAGFAPSDARGLRVAGEVADIVEADQPVHLGVGWHRIERTPETRFRWATDGAEITVAPTASSSLQLDLEPGPGVGGEAMTLEVSDETGAALSHAVLRGRERISVELPDTRRRTLRLHVVDGGQAVDTDDRILDFRAFSIELAPTAAAIETADVPTVGGKVVFGRGWHGPETVRNGTVFRWADNDARFHARTDRSTLLAMTLEPGPSLGRRTMKLEVRDDQDRLVATGTVRGKRRVHFRLPLEPGQRRAFALRVLDGGTTAPKDTRTLNFRVLDCEFVETHRRSLRSTVLQQTMNGLDAPPSSTRRAGERRSDEAARAPAAVAPHFIHTNACGDFTLLSRDQWFSLRGYPEFEKYSMNIDSILCFMARYNGAEEVMFEEPCRIYHIEHDIGSGWTPEGEEKLYSRLAAKGLGYVDYKQVLDWAVQMREHGKPILFSGDDWGYANVDLPETDPRA